jgi:hypothetical protein
MLEPESSASSITTARAVWTPRQLEVDMTPHFLALTIVAILLCARPASGGDARTNRNDDAAILATCVPGVTRVLTTGYGYSLTTTGGTYIMGYSFTPKAKR